MTELATLDGFATLIEPATLRIERLLPGPIERVWAYLTESELRRQWLADGEMRAEAGAAVDFVWRNDELSEDAGSARPAGFPEEQRMTARVLEAEPPRRLVITWGADGSVAFTLEPRDGAVLLTIVHARVSDRGSLLDLGAGWHAHLDVLAARLTGTAAPSFWQTWGRLKSIYDARLPG